MHGPPGWAASFDLPPLDQLEAFEAAARHLSFTRAGDELVADAVGRQPADQGARGRISACRCSGACTARCALTDDGQTLYAGAVAEALDAARTEATRELTPRRAREAPSSSRRRRASPALWLIPRLTAFIAAQPDVDVRISAGNALANLERDGVDLAIRYQPVDGGRRAGVPPVRRDRVPGLQPAPAARPSRRRCRARPIFATTRCCAWSPTAEPAAGLGPLAAGDEARGPAAGGRAALLVVRPADPGGAGRAGRRARPRAR